MENDYKIMIVDDERIVRESIASYIAWEKYQITVVNTSANAIEALEYIEEHEVNLILADIRMPVMDGIELLKHVRSRKWDIDFVILSGYADFDYAREAIRYGVKDYLLKPLDETALISVVLKCRDSRNNQQFINSINQTPIFKNIPNSSDKKNNYSQTINKIIQLVEEEIANEKLSLKWISSQKLFLNENYLGKVFQKEVKQKFSSYLLERRMLLAMQLLAGNIDATILDVAQSAGFGDNSQYFSTAFKKYTGYTPTDYKRKIKESKESQHGNY